MRRVDEPVSFDAHTDVKDIARRVSEEHEVARAQSLPSNGCAHEELIVRNAWERDANLRVCPLHETGGIEPGLRRRATVDEGRTEIRLRELQCSNRLRRSGRGRCGARRGRCGGRRGRCRGRRGRTRRGRRCANRCGRCRRSRRRRLGRRRRHAAGSGLLQRREALLLPLYELRPLPRILVVAEVRRSLPRHRLPVGRQRTLIPRPFRRGARCPRRKNVRNPLAIGEAVGARRRAGDDEGADQRPYQNGNLVSPQSEPSWSSPTAPRYARYPSRSSRRLSDSTSRSWPHPAESAALY
jgi:hypothetical protein